MLGPAWKTVAPFQPKSIAYNIFGQYCFSRQQARGFDSVSAVARVFASDHRHGTR